MEIFKSTLLSLSIQGPGCSRSFSFSGGRVPAKTQIYVNGAFRDANNPDRWIDVHNPATNEVVTQVLYHATHKEKQKCITRHTS